MSLSSHQSTVGKSQTWLTPPWILKPLGTFNTDPCAAPSPRHWDTAISHIEFPENGLESTWIGRVWLNPPFDRRYIGKWMSRMADHGNGIMLVPASMETKNFKQYVWDRATSILFLNKRPHFHVAIDTTFQRPKGKTIFVKAGEAAPFNSGATICLVGYGEVNDTFLRASNLGQWFQIRTPNYRKIENLLRGR